MTLPRIPLVLALVAAVTASPAIAQPQAPAAPAALPLLTLEQQTALRCGVAFALVSQGQKASKTEFAAYPPLAERGREFFVRVAAQLIDETGADRTVLSALVMKAHEQLASDPAAVPAIMPACLTMLDASGL